MTSYDLTPTMGVVGGRTIQIAEGHWPGEIGSGVAMSDEAFDIVAPLLAAVAPDWTPMHRYGVFELRPAVRWELASRFRSQAANLQRFEHTSVQAHLFNELASWLEGRVDERLTISVLGY